MNWGSWFYGLITAFVSGGAGAFGAVQGATMLAPQSFNLNGQIGNSLKLAVATFVMAGIGPFFAYLKNHPLPDVVSSTTVTVTQTKSAEPDTKS